MEMSVAEGAPQLGAAPLKVAVTTTVSSEPVVAPPGAKTRTRIFCEPPTAKGPAMEPVTGVSPASMMPLPFTSRNRATVQLEAAPDWVVDKV